MAFEAFNKLNLGFLELLLKTLILELLAAFNLNKYLFSKSILGTCVLL